jgi:allantoin racemase
VTKTLLVINPNTTHDITDRMLEVGRGLAPPGVSLLGQNGRFGARYISDRPNFVVAGHATLDAYAVHAGTVDAVYIACFGDPGLLALKELAAVPVVGMAEASFAAAAMGGRRFGIVTGGQRWRPMLQELAGELGYREQLASVETLHLTGGDIAANPLAAVDLLAEACMTSVNQHGAEAVILGGAGLVGLADHVRARVAMPVLCSVTTGFTAALAALHAPRLDEHAVRGVATVGLSPELERLLHPLAGQP